MSTAQVAGPNPGRLLFIGWLDACGAAFYDKLIKWTAHVFPGIGVARAPELLTFALIRTGKLRSLNCCAAPKLLWCAWWASRAAFPWVRLQLGACFRALGTSKPVVPVLLDVPDTALSSSPLGLFQAVHPTKEDFRRLVRDLSGVLANPSIERTALERFESTFDELFSGLDLMPGTAAQSFQIVLVLPDRVFPVSNSATYKDED